MFTEHLRTKMVGKCFTRVENRGIVTTVVHNTDRYGKRKEAVCDERIWKRILRNNLDNMAEKHSSFRYASCGSSVIKRFIMPPRSV